jgi:SAM-dependent methyltransferase
VNRALRPEDSTRRWYQSHVRKFGFGVRALGFGRRSSQEKRFAALARLGAFHGASLLDMGCGFGDLLAYLNTRGVRPLYTGVDACPPMIERCRRRFAQSDARFVTADAMSYEPEAPFDYVVASGIFGYEAKGARGRVQPTLERLFAMCRIGMGVNFLSACAAQRSPRRVYLYPWDVLEFAFTLTAAVRLDHSYLPNDFTVCLYRTPPWQEEKAT